jgi:hypothetical protein
MRVRQHAAVRLRGDCAVQHLLVLGFSDQDLLGHAFEERCLKITAVTCDARPEQRIFESGGWRWMWYVIWREV